MAENKNNSPSNDMIADLLSKLRQSIDKEGIQTSEEYLKSEEERAEGAREDATVTEELTPPEDDGFLEIDELVELDAISKEEDDAESEEFSLVDGDEVSFDDESLANEAYYDDGAPEVSEEEDEELTPAQTHRVYRITAYTPKATPVTTLFADELMEEAVDDHTDEEAEIDLPPWMDADDPHDVTEEARTYAVDESIEDEQYIEDSDTLPPWIDADENVDDADDISVMDIDTYDDAGVDEPAHDHQEEDAPSMALEDDEDDAPTAVFAAVTDDMLIIREVSEEEKVAETIEDEYYGDDVQNDTSLAIEEEPLEDEEYIYDLTPSAKKEDSVLDEALIDDTVDDDMITRPESIPDTDSFARVIVDGKAGGAPTVIKLDSEKDADDGIFVNTSSLAAEEYEDFNDDREEEIVGGEVGYVPPIEDYSNEYKIASSKDVKRRTGTFAAVKEYTSRDQIDHVFSEYKSKMFRGRVTIAMLAFLTTLLVVFENIGMLGMQLPWMFDLALYPRIGVLIDLQIVVFATALIYRGFFEGVRGAFTGQASAYSLLLPATVALLAHYAMTFVSNTPSPKLFGSVLCVYFLVSAICENSVLKREYNAFQIISASGDKLAACIMPSGIVRGEQEQFSNLDDKFKRYRILRIKKVGFVDGFFSRKDTRCDNSKLMGYLLVFISVLSPAFGVVAGIVAENVSVGFGAAALCALLATPATFLFAGSAPMNRASSIAHASETVIVGQSSAREYADINALSFEDVEMFPSKNVKVRRIKLYGDNRLDHVLYYTSSLFSFVGGPLAGVFSVATSETGVSSDVEFVDAEEDGLVVKVDGANVAVGKGSFMQRIGVALSYDSEDEKQSADRNISIMFAAVDGCVCAKFYVRYTADRAFEDNVARLAESGIKTVIRSYDPNIDNGFLTRMNYFDVRAVKKTKSQLLDFAQPRVDSGIVTRSTSSDILRAVLMCKRVIRRIRKNEKLGVTFSVLGMLIGAALGIFAADLGLYSIAAIVYALVAMIPAALASRFSA